MVGVHPYMRGLGGILPGGQPPAQLCADRVQAIGVLQDLALNGLGHDPQGERMDSDAIADRVN